jgi:hypothetical protein
VQLGRLREYLTTKAKTSDEFIAISEVVKAESASQNKDGKTVVNHLKNAGRWVFEAARDIGVDLVAELIKRQMGS